MLNDNVSTKRGNKGLTVKEMKEFLDKLPEDAYLVVSNLDHSYREVDRVNFTVAMRESTGSLAEFYGDDLTPEPEFGMKEYVVIVE